MSAKSILEYDGKALLSYWLFKSPSISTETSTKTVSSAPLRRTSPSGRELTCIVAQVQFESPLHIAPENYPAHVKEVLDRVETTCAWVKDGTKLVAKPDMLIKRRGKAGLLCLNKGWEESRKWIEERAGKLQKVQNIPPPLAQSGVDVPRSSMYKVT
jgi:ATP citrate (pro-S)-lyase